MVERGGGARLLLEAAQAIGVGGERGGQDLDRHVAPEPRIARAIDLAHAAGAERRDDLVRAEADTRSQGHRGWKRRRLYPPGF